MAAEHMKIGGTCTEACQFRPITVSRILLVQVCAALDHSQGISAASDNWASDPLTQRLRILMTNPGLQDVPLGCELGEEKIGCLQKRAQGGTPNTFPATSAGPACQKQCGFCDN